MSQWTEQENSLGERKWRMSLGSYFATIDQCCFKREGYRWTVWKYGAQFSYTIQSGKAEALFVAKEQCEDVLTDPNLCPEPELEMTKLTITIGLVETRPQRHLLIADSHNDERTAVQLARLAKVLVFDAPHKTELLGKLPEIREKCKKVGLIIR